MQTSIGHNEKLVSTMKNIYCFLSSARFITNTSWFYVWFWCSILFILYLKILPPYSLVPIHPRTTATCKIMHFYIIIFYHIFELSVTYFIVHGHFHWRTFLLSPFSFFFIYLFYSCKSSNKIQIIIIRFSLNLFIYECNSIDFN